LPVIGLLADAVFDIHDVSHASARCLNRVRNGLPGAAERPIPVIIPVRGNEIKVTACNGEGQRIGGSSIHGNHEIASGATRTELNNGFLIPQPPCAPGHHT
jgi:hypothetical protein